MDIYFQDPSDIPLPPEEVKIRALKAEPYPDGRRVRIKLEITPFQKQPNCEIRVMDENGDEAASLSIIETIDARMDFTVHLKGEDPSGTYSVSAEVYYFEEDQTEDPELEGEMHQLPSEVNLVDQRQTSFEING